MTPISACQARPLACSANPCCSGERFGSIRGFTLIEILIALGIMTLLAAVVMPGLVRRLSVAFGDADLQQVLSSANLLPARVATLGIDLQIENSTLDLRLPDGELPIYLPGGWALAVEDAFRISRTGSCLPGALLLREPISGRRWRLRFAHLSCGLEVTDLTRGQP